MSTGNQFGAAPQQSGGGGSTVLVVVLVILAVLVLGCGALCAGCMFLAKSAGNAVSKMAAEGLTVIALAPAYAEALSAVQANEKVIDRLGEQIEPQVESLTPYRRQGEGNLRPEGETIQFDVK